jgi:predicted AAA+ superfamily ATPase
VRPYLKRALEPQIADVLADRGAVLIDGPRACGKTTTATRFAASTVRLDVPGEAALFRADPDAALRAFPTRPLLIDEWQEVPEVIGAVKRAVDGGSGPGTFLLTGSAWPTADGATWPGTGRIARLSLGPLSVRERRGWANLPGLVSSLASGGAAAHAPTEQIDIGGYLDLALQGGFPEPSLDLAERARADWYSDYVDEIVRRDIAGIAPRTDVERFRTYVEAVALNSAGVTPHSTIFGAAGVTRRTGEAYDDLLRRISITDSVPAWTTSRLSQLGSLPRRFMIDAGLLAASARITREDIVRDGGLLGRVIETFVYAQIRSEIAAEHPRARIHHLRTDKGRHEVDLLIDLGGRRYVAIEVKSTAAPDRADARHLLWLRDRLGDDLLAGVVLHTGPHSFVLDARILALPISVLWNL